MIVKDAIKILESYPQDAEVKMMFYDFYGEQECKLLMSHNVSSNTVWISPLFDED